MKDGFPNRAYAAHTGIVTAHWISLIAPTTFLAIAFSLEQLGTFSSCQISFWQLLTYAIAIIFSASEFAIGSLRLRLSLILLSAITILIGSLIGLYQSGVEQGWWDGQLLCMSSAPSATNEDIVNLITGQSIGRGNETPTGVLGLPLAILNALGGSIAALAIFSLIPASLPQIRGIKIDETSQSPDF